jgi:hypothetical protein
LDVCGRELITLAGGGIEKKMAIIVPVKPRWNHHNISDFQRILSGKYALSLTPLIENVTTNTDFPNALIMQGQLKGVQYLC